MSKNQNKWDLTFLNIAEIFSKKSEDWSTKVGAVLVDRDNNVRALGYNGLPRKIKNTYQRQQKPYKYNYFVHAEINVIVAAARSGIATNNCKLYITHFPCADCAKAIIQAGIKEIVVNSPSMPKRWVDSIKHSIIMFRESGVVIKIYRENKLYLSS